MSIEDELRKKEKRKDPFITFGVRLHPILHHLIARDAKNKNTSGGDVVRNILIDYYIDSLRHLNKEEKIT
jgi:hypothetical protein